MVSRSYDSFCVLVNLHTFVTSALTSQRYDYIRGTVSDFLCHSFTSIRYFHIQSSRRASKFVWLPMDAQAIAGSLLRRHLKSAQHLALIRSPFILPRAKRLDHISIAVKRCPCFTKNGVISVSIGSRLPTRRTVDHDAPWPH